MSLLKVKKTIHIHKFKTVKQDTGRKVLKCMLGCPTYIAPELAIGREAICWRCGNKFILDEISIYLLKPHCKHCVRTKAKKKENINAIDFLTKALGG